MERNVARGKDCIPNQSRRQREGWKQAVGFQVCILGLCTHPSLAAALVCQITLRTRCIKVWSDDLAQLAQELKSNAELIFPLYNRSYIKAALQVNTITSSAS